MGRRKRNIDTISGLPDDILIHILSFLPMIRSVRTCVLSKRWRFLWAHVPNLEFHGDFLDRRKKKKKKKKKNKHLNTIDRVLSMHEAKTLNTFTLSYVKGCADRLEALITYAVERKVRNLHLHFYLFTEWALPRLLLTCETLVDLKLDNCGIIPSKGELFLPSLKKLYLRNVDYEDKESLPQLLSGCPVLEELFVENAFRGGDGKDLDCFIVSSPTIKTLNVHISLRRKVYNDEFLIIDVPALVYLKVDNCSLQYVKSLTNSMAYLIQAEIRLNETWQDIDLDPSEIRRSRAFLSSLCHVKYLKFSNELKKTETLLDIVWKSGMPKFVNLTKLELDLIVEWYYIVKFLRAADNLEVLVLKAPSWVYKVPKRVPTCMLSSLRTVTIDSFDFGYDDEGTFDVVSYILRNAKVLERMDIYGYSSTHKETLDAHQRISLFERGSKSCQLAFNPH